MSEKLVQKQLQWISSVLVLPGVCISTKGRQSLFCHCNLSKFFTLLVITVFLIITFRLWILIFCYSSSVASSIISGNTKLTVVKKNLSASLQPSSSITSSPSRCNLLLFLNWFLLTVRFMGFFYPQSNFILGAL